MAEAWPPAPPRRLIVQILGRMVLAIVVIEGILLVPATLHYREELRHNFFCATEAMGWRVAPRLAGKLGRTPADAAAIAELARFQAADTAVYDARGERVAAGAGSGDGAVDALVRRFVADRSQGMEQGEVQGRCYALFPLSAADGNLRGVLAVVKPQTEMLHETAFYVLRILGLVFVICAFTALALLLFLQRGVLRPIRSIVQLNRELAEDPSREIRLPPEGAAPNELGEILRTRTQMLLALRAAREEILAQNRELDAWSRTLERRVSERTADVERAQERLVQSEKLAAVGRLAAVVAHELNNPLGIMAVCVEELRRRSPATAARAATAAESRAPAGAGARSLEILHLQVGRCKKIIDTLLGFSRGRPEPPERIVVETFLRESLELLAHRARSEGKTLELAAGSAGLMLETRRFHLQQALLNLLDNALDAVPAAGRVLLAGRSAGSEVVMTVADDGPGMTVEVRGRLFEPFFTTKAPSQGNGIGLALAADLVQALGGVIECASEPGRGTVFTIRLPADARGAVMPAPPPASAPAAASGAARRGEERP